MASSKVLLIKFCGEHILNSLPDMGQSELLISNKTLFVSFPLNSSKILELMIFFSTMIKRDQKNSSPQYL